MTRVGCGRLLLWGPQPQTAFVFLNGSFRHVQCDRSPGPSDPWPPHSPEVLSWGCFGDRPKADQAYKSQEFLRDFILSANLSTALLPPMSPGCQETLRNPPRSRAQHQPGLDSGPTAADLGKCISPATSHRPFPSHTSGAESCHWKPIILHSPSKLPSLICWKLSLFCIY